MKVLTNTALTHFFEKLKGFFRKKSDKIETNDIADGAITSAQILDGTITIDDLAEAVVKRITTLEDAWGSVSSLSKLHVWDDVQEAHITAQQGDGTIAFCLAVAGDSQYDLYVTRSGLGLYSHKDGHNLWSIPGVLEEEQDSVRQSFFVVWCYLSDSNVDICNVSGINLYRLPAYEGYVPVGVVGFSGNHPWINIIATNVFYQDGNYLLHVEVNSFHNNGEPFKDQGALGDSCSRICVLYMPTTLERQKPTFDLSVTVEKIN